MACVQQSVLCWLKRAQDQSHEKSDQLSDMTEHQDQVFNEAYHGVPSSRLTSVQRWGKLWYKTSLLCGITRVTRRHLPPLCRHSSTAASFKAQDLHVTQTDQKTQLPDFNNLKFGQTFSDHILEVEWSIKRGWGKPSITPMHNLSLHPASKVLHYAVELFEGMKAYKGEDGKIRMFRPLENMIRMNSTAQRSCLPTFDGEELIECMKTLISIDKDWVPDSRTSSLYIRPTMIGTEPQLGVSRPESALLFVIIGPVGAYYPTGLKPVTLLADPKYVRAWPGGSGQYKMGANYGPTLSVGQDAEKQGCQQVLWLYGEDQQVTEVGAMNIFMYWINEQGEKELITAPLNGLILPGITRKSLLELARGWGEYKVSEREYTMGDIVKGLKENRVKELFGAGTACVVCPVEKILYNNEMLQIPTMSEGAPVAMKFYNTLLDIQSRPGYDEELFHKNNPKPLKAVWPDCNAPVLVNDITVL
ncbi:hypothetical protein FSP39_010377 [Pinctada imbricata]|uniref:Branched-chain-amino-acid aminotransferase n=1 Tax=Pinctada imbricata TaxID=66713 RepID=A0AA88YBM6_PINIB|nr:hypothetical protein FSP39_010377 [Pinctada imbricata]